MEGTISRLEDEKANLEKEVSDLKRSCEMIEKRAGEQKVADEKNHAGNYVCPIFCCKVSVLIT